MGLAEGNNGETERQHHLLTVTKNADMNNRFSHETQTYNRMDIHSNQTNRVRLRHTGELAAEKLRDTTRNEKLFTQRQSDEYSLPVCSLADSSIHILHIV